MYSLYRGGLLVYDVTAYSDYYIPTIKIRSLHTEVYLLYRGITVTMLCLFMHEKVTEEISRRVIFKLTLVSRS